MGLLDKAYYHNWNIGFIENSIKEVVLSEQNEFTVHWVKHSYKDRFFADPFLLSVTEDEIKVLVEDFPYYDKKGMISLLVVDRKTYELKEKRVLLKKPFHMSYPFILQKDNGDMWVAPEASMSGNMYRYSMNKEKGLLDNPVVVIPEPALDSTIFEKDGKWWLFCTKRGPASNKELFIYYAERPEGPYKAHKGNPVMSNLSMARPAGNVFIDGKDYYRVCQECTRCYGEYINISRISKLTDTDYEETFVKSIHAQQDEYSGGFHTINGLGNLCVVDGLNTTFAPLRRLAYEITNLFKK